MYSKKTHERTLTDVTSSERNPNSTTDIISAGIRALITSKMCIRDSLKNYGRIMLFASSCDTLDNLHIVDVESAYCIARCV